MIMSSKTNVPGNREAKNKQTIKKNISKKQKTSGGHQVNRTCNKEKERTRFPMLPGSDQMFKNGNTVIRYLGQPDMVCWRRNKHKFVYEIT